MARPIHHSHSPSDIEVMLYHYYSPEPHPRENAPAVKAAIEKFVRAGLLKWSDETQLFETTKRGNKWVQMICDTPYPEGETGETEENV